jgi:oxepin-CoA hydrolase/3-oxo-5,6-dehydrosuberyl-CoA semialdehyde dehydrogenase
MVILPYNVSTMFIDINNRKELLRLFLCLTPDAVPLWGKMNAQEMVEHLIDQALWITRNG